MAETCTECLDPEAMQFCDRPATRLMVLWPNDQALRTPVFYCEEHGHAEHTQLLLREDIPFRYERIAPTEDRTHG